MPGFVPLRDPRRACRIERALVAVDHVPEIVAHEGKFDIVCRARIFRNTARRVDQEQQLIFDHGVAGGGVEPEDDASDGRAQHVFHLHRVEDGDLLVLADGVAGAHFEAHNRALHRRKESATLGLRASREGGPGRCRWLPLAVGQHGQRVVGVNLCSGGVTGKLGRASQDGLSFARSRERGNLLIGEGRMELPGDERRVIQQVHQKSEVDGHPADPSLAERPSRPANGVRERPGRSADDDLGEQRIECRRSGIPGIGVGIHAHAEAARWLEDR